MATLTVDLEVAVDVPPAAIFEAIVKIHEIVVEVGHGKVKSASIVQGDGGVGSITQIDFVEDGTVKERIDSLDKEAFEVKISVIEGSEIGTRLKSATLHFKFVSNGGAGSICKAHGEYTPLTGVDFNENDLNSRKNKITKMFQAVGAYIAAKA